MSIFMDLVISYKYMLANVNLLNTNLDQDYLDYLLIYKQSLIINYEHYYQ